MSDCPDGVQVQAGVPFTWHTDSSITHSGFQVCMAGPPTDDQCAAINDDAHSDPTCNGSYCPLECALSHLAAMNTCVDNFPDPRFRQTCQNVVDALVDNNVPTPTPASETSCYFSGDGDCDEPSQCAVGTDVDCAPADPSASRPSNVCPADDACPLAGSSERVRATWTEMLYYDADNNLEQFNVGTLNGLSSEALGGNVVVTSAGERTVEGEYVPLLAAHKAVAGSEVFAQEKSTGGYTGLAIFVSHTSESSRVWVLADLGPSLSNITASWLYSVESDARRPPVSGWISEHGDGPAPTLATTATTGPASCVGNHLNMVVLVDRCREDTEGCDRHDHHEIIGIVDADGNSVNGIFTGAKRLQLLPPDSAGRWLDLDESMQPLHAGSTTTDPEPDTSRGDTLSQFVRAAIAAYPADHYFLEISDHGGAWYGAIQDFDSNVDSSSLPIMDVETLQSALDAALDTDQKIDIISFDACLMASQTIAAALAPHAHYLIASELSIMVSPAISDPWNHRAHVPYSADGPQTAEEYGRDVVDQFVDCGGVDTMQTMSLVSLDAYATFSEAMTAVANILTTAAADPSNDVIVTAVQVVNNLDADYGNLGGEHNDMGSCKSYTVCCMHSTRSVASQSLTFG